VFDPLEHFGGRAGAKPKEQDASMGLSMRNHQLAEVAIIGNHDATFASGDLKDLNVFNRGRVVLGYGCYVMTELPEAGGDQIIGTFIQQEPHAWPAETAEVARGAACERLRATLVWA
jgi:hypothetical protein